MKKLLALVLALVMTLSLAVVGSNAAFKDAKDTTETYAEAVDVLSGMGVFNGYKNADGTYSFQPKGEITRAEVAAIVYRLYTADVTDKQASLYATYNKFNDMNGAKWAAGYIGYCANAGLVKGYDAKTFGPANKVTGYEALAMILRAIGYDKNGEFTGAQWQLRVASTAQQLGILKNVKGVDLNAAATRELVAELLFRTATVPMVSYTPAFGYVANSVVGAQKSLGEKNFGLKEYKGYVVANAATGENYTVVAADRKGTSSFNLDKETGLEMIGHKVSGWYDATSAKTDKYGAKYTATVYSVNDLSTAETVLTAAELNGKISKTTVYSNNYALFTSTAYTPLASKYVVIDGGEAIISLVQGVARVYAIDNYAVTKTMTLTADNNSTKNIYKQSDLTGIDGLAVNDYVVTTVIGSVTNLSKLEKTVSGTYSYRDAQGTITLTDGTKLTKSPLFTAAHTAGMPQVDAALSIAKTVVFVLDEDGRYVSYQEADAGYLFGTYAYYTVDNAATAQLSYYLTGVTIDGQVVTKKITAADYNGVLIQGRNTVGQTNYTGIANLSTIGQAINNANVKGDDFVINATSTADLFTIGDWTNGSANVSTVAGTTVNKTSATIGSSANYFVDENTTFYFVTGSVSAPEVQTVTGKTALLAGGDSYVLPADSVMSTSVLNYTYGSAANYHVDKVLVKGAYSANSAKDLYYVTDGALTATGLTGVNTVKEVYSNDKIVPVWTNASSTLTANKFYFHNKVESVYNNPVEALTEVSTVINSGVSAWYNATTVATGSWDLYLRDNTNSVKVSNDAVVVDLRPEYVSTAAYADGYVGTKDLAAISTFADLVKTAAMYNFTVDAAGTTSGATVVYIKSAKQINTNAQYTVYWSDASVCEVVSGYNGTSGTKVPYNGTVKFYLKGAAASSVTGAIQGTPAEGVSVSYSMNGVEKTVDPLLEVVNGVQTYVYTVSGITADVTIKVNRAPAAATKLTIGNVTYASNAYTVKFTTAADVTPATYQVIIGNTADTGKVANPWGTWHTASTHSLDAPYAAVNGTGTFQVTVNLFDAAGSLIATGTATRTVS